MLQPKRVKYRKVQKAKGNMKGISGRGTNFQWNVWNQIFRSNLNFSSD